MDDEFPARLDPEALIVSKSRRDLDAENRMLREQLEDARQQVPWMGARQPGKRRVYLSGPMTGLPDLNFPAFHVAAADLRSLGLEVANPAEINGQDAIDSGRSYQDCLRNDIKALCDCDAIVMLPGWERSKGAHLELHVAHRLGLDVEIYVEQLLRCDSCSRPVAEHGPLLQFPAKPVPAASTDPASTAHTDHPLQHWDRTCPACQGDE